MASQLTFTEAEHIRKAYTSGCCDGDLRITFQDGAAFCLLCEDCEEKITSIIPRNDVT